MKPTKIIAAIIIAQIAFACKKEKQANDVVTMSETVEKTVDTQGLFVPLAATKADYLKAEKANVDVIDTLSTSKYKVKGKITLLLNNKKTLVFKDTIPVEDETATVAYYYLGDTKKPDFHLVEGSFWEWNECYMINKENGKTDTLWTMPVFSPDKKLFVNLSPPYGMEGDPNGFQLWEIKNKIPGKIKIMDQQEWIPKGVYWENNHTLIFKAVTVDTYTEANYEPSEKDFYYFRIKVK